jgi:D-amino-acid dehydrogenase
VRVAGGAQLGGEASALDARTVERLYQVLDDWFPGVAHRGHAQRWKGARPMLPDGLPVVGASGAPGVWLNLGHGASGWTLACGSARLLADALAGRAPAFDGADALGAARLR